MNPDVLAHIFLGSMVLLIAVVLGLEAFKKLPTQYSSIVIGILALSAGIFYNYIIFGHIELNVLAFKSLDPTNQQHFILDYALILFGVTLIASASKYKLNLAVRTIILVLAALVLLNHTQPHEFAHASWLAPYHQAISILLLMAASSYFAFLLGAKPPWPIVIPAACLVMIGVLLVMYHDPAVHAHSCETRGKTIVVNVGADSFDPTVIQAEHCDVLHIVSSDGQKHKVAFGDHDQHEHYGNYSEETIDSDHTTDIVLSEPGSFSLHDHLNDDVTATLQVNDSH